MVAAGKLSLPRHRQPQRQAESSADYWLRDDPGLLPNLSFNGFRHQDMKLSAVRFWKSAGRKLASRYHLQTPFHSPRENEVRFIDGQGYYGPSPHALGKLGQLDFQLRDGRTTPPDRVGKTFWAHSPSGFATDHPTHVGKTAQDRIGSQRSHGDSLGCGDSFASARMYWNAGRLGQAGYPAQPYGDLSRIRSQPQAVAKARDQSAGIRRAW